MFNRIQTQNFTVEVWEWICNFTQHFIMDVITYPRAAMVCMAKYIITNSFIFCCCICFVRNVVVFDFNLEVCHCYFHFHFQSFNGKSIISKELVVHKRYCVKPSYTVISWAIYVKCVENGESLWSLRWRHNGDDSVSNRQPHDCLFNRLFKRRSK